MPASKNLLSPRPIIRICLLPNSHVPVAACQSVGIRTRGRTAARCWRRMEGDGYPLKSRSRFPSPGNCHRTATGSRRRNRRTPNLHGGRSLKQRRNGLFLVSLVLQRPAPKRLVLHCRACGVSPSDGYQGPDVSFGDVRRFQRVADRSTDSSRLHVASAPLAPEGDASHDRAHP